MIFKLKFPKGNNPVKMKVELWFLFSAHRLMAFNICTKLLENISKGFKVIEWTRFPQRYFQKGIIPSKCRCSYSSYSLHIV